MAKNPAPSVLVAFTAAAAGDSDGGGDGGEVVGSVFKRSPVLSDTDHSVL